MAIWERGEGNQIHPAINNLRLRTKQPDVTQWETTPERGQGNHPLPPSQNCIKFQQNIKMVDII